jgi:hypothetical protein
MKEFLHVTALVLINFMVATALTNSAHAQVKSEPAASLSKTERLLKEISSTYTVLKGKNTFLVPFEGKHKKDIEVIIVESDDMIVLFSTVADGKEIEFTPTLMRKLLEFNMQADHIKVGISERGSIDVQAEAFLSWMEPKSFQAVLDQIAAGANIVSGIVAPFKKGGTVK